MHFVHWLCTIFNIFVTDHFLALRFMLLKYFLLNQFPTQNHLFFSNLAALRFCLCPLYKYNLLHVNMVLLITLSFYGSVNKSIAPLSPHAHREFLKLLLPASDYFRSCKWHRPFFKMQKQRILKTSITAVKKSDAAIYRFYLSKLMVSYEIRLN